MGATWRVGRLAPVVGAVGIVTLATVWPQSSWSPAARPDTGGVSRQDPRAAIFVQRGCTECHAITALRVKAGADVGPDLTFAYGDVVTRYGVNLESFLYSPPGVMRLMLAAHLHLSLVDRDSMLHVLKGLYLERRADFRDEVPSVGERERAP
jgi:hypothetical protein